MRWLAHVLGLDSATGYWYMFWSGFGGDLAIADAMLSAPAIYWRHHRCREERCRRLGHPVAGGPDVKSRHHHPAIGRGGPDSG